GSAGFRLVTIVPGKSAQDGVADDVAVFGVLTAEHRAHAVVEDLGRYPAARCEGGGVATQQGLQVLAQHEATPQQPAMAEDQREQPADPLDPGLIGEHRAEMREVDLGLAAGWGLEAQLEAGRRAWTHLAQEVLHGGVAPLAAGFTDPAMP